MMMKLSDDRAIEARRARVRLRVEAERELRELAKAPVRLYGSADELIAAAHARLAEIKSNADAFAQPATRQRS